jgi:hypothetical protein
MFSDGIAPLSIVFFASSTVVPAVTPFEPVGIGHVGLAGFRRKP